MTEPQIIPWLALLAEPRIIRHQVGPSDVYVSYVLNCGSLRIFDNRFRSPGAPPLDLVPFNIMVCDTQNTEPPSTEEALRDYVMNYLKGGSDAAA